MNHDVSLSRIRSLATRDDLSFERHADAYQEGVVTCIEAAHARRVDLSNELKHLLIDTSDGFKMVHIPGDKRLSLRKVKRFLKVKQARLADLDTHPDVERGSICPFVEPFWAYPHLIDRSVLTQTLMTTNDSTLTGYLEFDPQLLLLARETFVSDFKAE